MMGLTRVVGGATGRHLRQLGELGWVGGAGVLQLWGGMADSRRGLGRLQSPAALVEASLAGCPQLHTCCCRPCRPPQVAIRKHPLAGGLTAWTAAACAYLALFSAYWLVAAVSGSTPAGAAASACWCCCWLLVPLAAAACT